MSNQVTYIMLRVETDVDLEYITEAIESIDAPSTKIEVEDKVTVDVQFDEENGGPIMYYP